MLDCFSEHVRNVLDESDDILRPKGGQGEAKDGQNEAKGKPKRAKEKPRSSQRRPWGRQRQAERGRDRESDLAKIR